MNSATLRLGDPSPRWRRMTPPEGWSSARRGRRGSFDPVVRGVMSTPTDPQGQSARCDYCGRPREEVGILVPGANAEHPLTICRACVTQAGMILDAEDQQRPSSQDLLADIPTPKQV